MYLGWADPVVPPEDTIDYYQQVKKVLGPATENSIPLRFQEWDTAAEGPEHLSSTQLERSINGSRGPQFRTASLRLTKEATNFRSNADSARFLRSRIGTSTMIFKQGLPAFTAQ